MQTILKINNFEFPELRYSKIKSTFIVSVIARPSVPSIKFILFTIIKKTKPWRVGKILGISYRPITP